ncbi:MAG TPA: NINE protein [Cellvibrio sp.]|nr:NINE protein [Cellvibrio sp.]
MSEVRLDIYLLGEPQPGVDRATLVRNLAATFKKEVPVIEKMLRKPRSLLKANVDTATAAKYKVAIQRAGGQCEWIKHGEQLFPSEALTAVAPRPALALTPIEPAPTTRADDDSAAADEANYSSAGSSPYVTPETDSAAPDQFCYQCGRSIASGLPQCPYCRAPQIQWHRKSKVTAGFLAFFLGGFGVHRFYLGQWWGIFYLIFCATLIPGFVALIEALVFWFTPQERWDNKYGRVPAASSGLKAVVAVAGIFAFIFVIGILAAIALPAYQEYTVRAKVHAAMPLIEQSRQKVTEVIKQKDFYPSENLLAGLPETISNDMVTSIELGEGARLTVTFNAPSLRDGKNTIIWTPTRQGNEVSWTCTAGTMPDNYRTPECRGGSGAVGYVPEQASAPTRASTHNILRIYSDDKQLSLSVADNWKTNRQLNKEAVLGIANIEDEIYAIVLREAKAAFGSAVSLQDYSDLIFSGLKTSAPSLEVVEPVKDLQINGLPAQQQRLGATLNGAKIAYLVTTFNGQDHFFVVYTWTVQARFEKNKTQMENLIQSFSVHQ